MQLPLLCLPAPATLFPEPPQKAIGEQRPALGVVFQIGMRGLDQGVKTEPGPSAIRPVKNLIFVDLWPLYPVLRTS